MERESWDSKHVVIVFNSVRINDMGLKEATGPFSVPRSTLKYWHEFRVSINEIWIDNQIY
jgi:hypothetical protein